MKRRMKQVLGWIHGGILLSVLSPILYGLAIRDEIEYDMGRIWLLNLLIFLVVVGTDLLVERCREMGVYLIFSGCCVLVVNLAAWKLHGFAGVGKTMDAGVGVTVILALESVYVFIERILIRLHDKRSADRQEDPDWRPRRSILTQPQVVYVTVPVSAYGVGKYCNNPTLCDISMGLLPLYLCTALFYIYLDETEDYMFLNKRVCNLPRRRLYGISGSICLAFMAGILCMGILAGVTAGHRDYYDIRDLFKGQADINGAPPAQLWEELDSSPGWDGGMPYMPEMEIMETPAWIKIMEKGLAAAAVILFLLLGIYSFHRISRLFRETYDENGDVVEELEEEAAERVKSVRVNGRNLTEADRIRRQYRRTIRQHRKDQPGRHETPYEIESGAGIADTEEGQRLHEAYEQVRYREKQKMILPF